MVDDGQCCCEAAHYRASVALVGIPAATLLRAWCTQRLPNVALVRAIGRRVGLGAVAPRRAIRGTGLSRCAAVVLPTPEVSAESLF